MQPNKILATIPAWPFFKNCRKFWCAALDQSPVAYSYYRHNRLGYSVCYRQQENSGNYHSTQGPYCDGQSSLNVSYDLLKGIGSILLSLILQIVILYLFVFILDSQVSRLMGKKSIFKNRIRHIIFQLISWITEILLLRTCTGCMCRDISWQQWEIVVGCEGSWFVFVTLCVGAKDDSCSGKAPRKYFGQRVSRKWF